MGKWNRREKSCSAPSTQRYPEVTQLGVDPGTRQTAFNTIPAPSGIARPVPVSSTVEPTHSYLDILAVHVVLLS
jgi:hypothetical protein